MRRTEQVVLTEKTRWTSRRNALQAQVRQANLTIAKAEREQQTEMERQWVRAPVTG